MYKSVISCILFMYFTGCKNEKREVNSNGVTVNAGTEKIVRRLNIVNMDLWEYKGVTLTNTNEIFQNQEVYKMAIIDHAESFDLVAVNNIKLDYTS